MQESIVDTDSTCRHAFEANSESKFISKDVNDISKEEINSFFSENSLKILVGCAPCQPFPSYSFKHKEKDEKKLNLLYAFSRIVKDTEPTIIAMENVPQLINPRNLRIFNDFLKSLYEMNYNVNYEIVHCPDYGVPQTRKRLVLLASKLGKITLIPKTHKPGEYETVRKTIEQLPPIKAGEQHPDDPLHRARALSAINIQRIRHTTEGGSWKDDWPDELLLECYKKKSGKTYSSVYGRMKWDAPSPTMTTHCTGLGNGRFGHPSQDRAISLREAALLQTFPIDYEFFETEKDYNPSIVCRQIGNAVPPKLGEVIGKSIKKHLNGHGYDY